MSDTLYAARKYIRFTGHEIFSLAITSVVGGFAINARDLLFERFGEAAAIVPFLATVVMLFLLCAFAVWCAKLVAVRIGYTISYVPHNPGLIAGLVLTAVSAGFLPMFLPGGFRYARPELLRIGKHESWYKGWEIGLISAVFPLAFTFFLLPLNALYLITGTNAAFLLVTVAWLTALYACLPFPMLGHHIGELKDAKDVVKALRGTSFGLDVFYASGPWYIILCAYVLVVGLLAWALSAAGMPLGLWVYGLSVLLALIAWWVIKKFFR